MEIRKNNLNNLNSNLCLDNLNGISNVLEEFNKKHQIFIREIFKNCSEFINGISISIYDKNIKQFIQDSMFIILLL